MPRVSSGMATRKRRKKVLKLAKGYWGSKSKHFKMAKQAVMKSSNYAFVGRKRRKRDFRRLWITRISTACRLNGSSYSVFMKNLKDAGVNLNRKIVSEIAISDMDSFKMLLDTVSLKTKTTTKGKSSRNDDIGNDLEGKVKKVPIKV